MSKTYDWAVRFVGTLLRLFFRRVEVVGLQHVPAEGGGLLLAYHPNGLVDPALIFSQLPRPIVFGARHGLFKWPLLGSFMRAIGTVPIYRATDDASGDAAARRERNERSLDALAQAIADGSFSALFPEGISHDSPHLATLKTGAARLYYRARALAAPGQPPPAIVPVGLHYDDKRTFRSKALVRFYPPIDLPPELLALPKGADEQVVREHARKLTGVFERVLIETVHATESWQLHHAMQRTRALMRAERAERAGVTHPEPDMLEWQLGFARVWTGYHQCMQRDPDGARALLARIEAYDAALRGLNLEDDEIDRDPRLVSPWLPVIAMLQLLFVYLLLPPLLFFGYVVNGPPYFALKLIARGGKLEKDVATLKLLGGLLLFPLFWFGAAAAVALGQIDLHQSFPAVPRAPWTAALITLLLSVGGGALALRYMELSQQTMRSVRVRFTRRRYRRMVLRLRGERAALHDAIEAMSADLALPGVLDPSGRVGDRHAWGTTPDEASSTR